MSNSAATLRNLAISALLGMVAAIPAAYADDTEIYTGLNNLQNTVDPNVMFIIDTSGSMSIRETLATQQYDPATVYQGNCSQSRVYWSTNGQAPSCFTNRYFQKSSFRCDAAQTPLFSTTNTGTGFVQDRLARFSPASFFFAASWTFLSTSVRNPIHVECRSDEGLHGENAGSSAKFITASGNQPYTTNANQKKNWANTGGFYTLYSANYLNYFNNPNNTQSARRIDIVKDVVKELIDANSNLNVSLMRFDRNAHGGPIIFPFTDIDEANVKTNFKNTVNTLNASSLTPLSETLSEALRVFRGDNAVFGLSPPANWMNPSVPGAFESGIKYDSPLDVQCQKNFIVFLSDGEPTGDSEANTFTNNLIKNVTLPSQDNSCGSGGDNCLDELAEFMNTQDLIPGLDGKQNVVTYTIGFGSAAAGSQVLNDLLFQTASKGGGDAFIAQDFRQLSNVFTQIITEIQAVNSTFTAPAVSVNAFNRVTNREELFFTLFKPKEAPVWTGNLKKYRLGLAIDGDGNIIADEDGNNEIDEPEIRDRSNKKAVDSETGFFATDSTSFWSLPDSPDGDETAKGGAARLLGTNAENYNPDTRKIYSNIASGVSDLANTANRVSSNNTALTSDFTKLGLSAAPQPSGEPTGETVLQWLEGKDVRDEDGDGTSDDARAIMGDPLHSKPLLVEYGQADTGISDTTIYMTTNEGILHAINSDDGTEIFSFIPKQHLAKAGIYFLNSGTGMKEYGLDGPISLYFKDVDGDGFLDTGDGDQYILIVGERRGGTRYYALDITSRTTPKILWNITGGTGDFYELGQTWSAPQQARIKINGTAREVLIFGGGYDATNGDQQSTARGDGHNAGRAIYMVDPSDGSLVWWAGKSTLTGPNPGDVRPNLKNVCFSDGISRDCAKGDMNFSIASDLRLVQLDGDGLLDRIYASDTGGQLLRIDINNGAENASGLADGYIVADLQRTGASAVPTLKDNRRFFFAPDPALINPSDGEPFISLSIGSGFRAHPLDTDVEDKMFMVKDTDPFAKPSIYKATRTLEDLKDVTNDLDPTDLASFKGWFISLVNSSGAFEGKKVLSTATTFGGVVFFTAFSPVAGASAGSCAPNQGAGTVFAVNVEDASPDDTFEYMEGGTASGNPRVVSTLVRTGIPPEVTILFPPQTLTGKPVGFVAAERLNIGFTNAAVKTYWFEQETQ